MLHFHYVHNKNLEKKVQQIIGISKQDILEKQNDTIIETEECSKL